MSFRNAVFGYSKKDVNRYITELNNYILVLREDINYLKREYALITEKLDKMSLYNIESNIVPSTQTYDFTNLS